MSPTTTSLRALRATLAWEAYRQDAEYERFLRRCDARNRIACERWTDRDGDGVPDVFDNCPATWNPGQADFDIDGLGDVCDLDDDSDRTHDFIDPRPRDGTIRLGTPSYATATYGPTAQRYTPTALLLGGQVDIWG
jgi:hypothetical protein